MFGFTDRHNVNKYICITGSMLLVNLVKIEKQKYHSIETVPKYDKKVIETEVKSITNM
jgi:hypothetical protein